MFGVRRKYDFYFSLTHAFFLFFHPSPLPLAHSSILLSIRLSTLSISTARLLVEKQTYRHVMVKRGEKDELHIHFLSLQMTGFDYSSIFHPVYKPRPPKPQPPKALASVAAAASSTGATPSSSSAKGAKPTAPKQAVSKVGDKGKGAVGGPGSKSSAVTVGGTAKVDAADSFPRPAPPCEPLFDLGIDSELLDTYII